MFQKQCPICKATFETYPSIDSLTCSKRCAGKRKTRLHIEKSSRPCAECGKEFVPKHNKAPGIFCSYACRGKADRKEEVGGTDYVRVRADGHPNASKQGYVLKHRLIMESMVGRFLGVDEVVHHIDGDTTNNAEDNLLLLSVGKHNSYHARKRARNADGTMV